MKLWKPKPTFCQCSECGCLGCMYIIDFVIFGIRISWGTKWHCFDMEIDKDIKNMYAYHVCDSFVPANECPSEDDP